MAFPGPNARHPDFFPLTVLDAILGGAKGMGLFGGSSSNRSNRLYRALVDKELAVGAGVPGAGSTKTTVPAISSRPSTGP